MLTPHQLKQQHIINEMDRQARHNALNFSSVAPVEDYAADSRLCLTSVHIPKHELIKKVQSMLIEPLKEIEPNFYYYSTDSLHLTIKNIRVINDPSHFTDETIKVSQEVFSETISKYKKFRVFFYKLILFPNNLSLIGTTDPEFDDLFFNLDRELKEAGIPDDKKYLNSKYFFCNMTLCRFNSEPSSEFIDKVKSLEAKMVFEAYTVDSVTLLSCNAAFQNRNILGNWDLR